MKIMPVRDAPLVRIHRANRQPCAWWEHEWIRFVDEHGMEYVLFVLCGHCGLMPAEALDQMVMVWQAPVYVYDERSIRGTQPEAAEAGEPR